MKFKLTVLVATVTLMVLAVVGGIMLHAKGAHAQTFTALSAGEASSCALTASGGAVKCWGRNGEGQLGLGTTAAPYAASTLPLPVCATGVWNGAACSGGSSFSGVYALSIGATANHFCGTIVYLIIECWGDNYYGQLGTGSTGGSVVNPGVVICQSTSTYCNTTYHLLAGIVGIGTASTHSCAVDYAGDVWCWGENGAGQV